MKRRTAIIVCLLLLLSMTLSAQALELPYQDANAIHSTNAVAMLTDLSLLEGDETHTFHPDGNLSRAEVAKLAALIIDPKPTAQKAAPFSDIDRCWAKEYISFCYERGFLAGYTDGSFAPDAPVTARELVKMLLGAVGYDLSGVTGHGWDAELDALAEKLRIYNGYELDPGRPISRDYAARLVLNALNCSAVIGYDNGEPVFLEDDLLNPVTVLEHRFGVIAYQQVIVANEYVNLEEPGAALDEGTTKLYGHYAMDFATELGNIGRTVTVYLRDGQVVGVPVYDPEEFCVTVGGQNAAELMQLGGYTLAADAQIYSDGLPADAAALEALDEMDSVTVIDYESDGEIDLALIYRWAECEVIQPNPLVARMPDGDTQVFVGKASAADTVRVIRLNGQWVLKTF